MSKCSGGAWVVTRYPDGTEVHAHPVHSPETEVTRSALGYPTQEAMTLEHDPFHTLVSELVLGRTSPTLRMVAAGERVSQELAAAEEDAVMAVQKFLNIARKELWESNVQI